METLDHAIFSCLALFLSYYFMPRKIIWILQLFPFADGGNQTQVASTVSEHAIHYTIAPRQDLSDSYGA